MLAKTVLSQSAMFRARNHWILYTNQFQTSFSHRATVVESMMPSRSKLTVARTGAGKDKRGHFELPSLFFSQSRTTSNGIARDRF